MSERGLINMRVHPSRILIVERLYVARPELDELAELWAR